MKYKIFVLFGKDKCRIFENDEVQKFSKIKDEINIYEFNTFEELEAFKKGVDEAIGIDKSIPSPIIGWRKVEKRSE